MRLGARQEKLADFRRFVHYYDVCQYAREQARPQPWTEDVTLNAYDLRSRVADRPPSLASTRAALKSLGFRNEDFSRFNLYVYETTERLATFVNRGYLETQHLIVAYYNYQRLKSGRITRWKKN